MCGYLRVDWPLKVGLRQFTKMARAKGWSETEIAEAWQWMTQRQYVDDDAAAWAERLARRARHYEEMHAKYNGGGKIL